MYTEITPFFLLTAIYYLFSILFAWYIPGLILVRGQKIPFLAKITLALPTGLGMWGFAGLIFGSLHMRFLFYPYIIIFLLIFFRQFSFSRFVSKLKISIDPITVIILLTGICFQVLSVWFMGVSLFDSVRYCCGHIPDNHLFLAITNELMHNFPPYEPGVYQAPLQNYHFLSHLVVADIINIFHLPLVATTYQCVSWTLSLSLGLSALAFSSILQLGRSFRRWLLFFLYFGADGVFIILILTRSAFPFALNAMEAGTGMLFNYPRAFSIVILITGLSWLIIWHRRKLLFTGIVTAILFGTAYGYKAFTGLFVWPGLALLGALSLFRKDKQSIFMITGALAIGLTLHFSTNQESGGMFFDPMWRIHDFLSMREVGLPNMLLARQVFVEHNNWLRIALSDITMAIIFLFATFGAKVIGLIQTPVSLKKFPLELHVVLLSGLITSFILGMFFLQTQGGSITVNFLITVFIICSFYTALNISHVLDPLFRSFFWIPAIFIIFTTIPRSLWMTYKNIKDISIPASPYQKENMKLFHLIRDNTPKESLILPIGFSLTYDNLWIKYFTDRNIYISGNFRGPIVTSTMMLREDVLSKTQTMTDPITLKKLLSSEHINYLLVQKGTFNPKSSVNETFKLLYTSPGYEFFKIVQ